MTALQQLVALGLPEWVATGAREALGPDAAASVATNPWSVLAVPGVRPEQADSYARSRLGPAARPDDPRRGAALVSWLVSRAARDGHTLLPGSVAAAALAAYRVADGAAAVAAATEAGSIVAGPDNTLALRRHAEAERAIADAVADSCAAIPAAGPRGPADGPPAAFDALVERALDHRVATVTGPPGDRLDDVVRALASTARARGLSVTAVAPTAGAASRLSRLGDVPALTDAQAAAESDDAKGLVLVGDAHALDVGRAAALVRATAGCTCLVLTGDVRGLPPIDGPGNPLRDLAASGLVAGVDVEADRPGIDVAATIADLATCIGHGVLPPVESPGKDVVVMPAGSADAALRRTTQLATDSIPRSLGIDPAEVMVLTPAVRGRAGATALNALLKAEVNPGPGEHDGFDIGDRVVVATDLGDRLVGAGDIGAVSKATPDALLVDVAGREIRVRRPVHGTLRHAWALTVARTAAGRWPACVLVLPAESAGLLSRALLRTAVSRAERHLSIVHAAGSVVARTVTHGRDRRRRTALPALLREAFAQAVNSSSSSSATDSSA